MAITINRVRELAGREHLAEGIRDRANENWRKAWWDLTIALADVPEGEVNKACEAAATELGQTKNRMKTRRRVGQAVTPNGRGCLEAAPPTLAVQWVLQGHRLDEAALQHLIDAEREGLSLRELVQQLAEGAGKEAPGWTRPVGEPTPDRREQIVREELMANPKIVDEVSRAPAVRRAVDEQRQAEAVQGVQRMRDAGIRPDTELEQEQAPFNAAMVAITAMGAVQRSLRTAVRAIRDVNLEDEDRAILLGYRDGTEGLLKAFGQALVGDIDAELARLLDQDSS